MVEIAAGVGEDTAAGAAAEVGEDIISAPVFVLDVEVDGAS